MSSGRRSVSRESRTRSGRGANHTLSDDSSDSSDGVPSIGYGEPRWGPPMDMYDIPMEIDEEEEDPSEEEEDPSEEEESSHVESEHSVYARREGSAFVIRQSSELRDTARRVGPGPRVRCTARKRVPLPRFPQYIPPDAESRSPSVPGPQYRYGSDSSPTPPPHLMSDSAAGIASYIRQYDPYFQTGAPIPAPVAPIDPVPMAPPHDSGVAAAIASLMAGPSQYQPPYQPSAQAAGPSTYTPQVGFQTAQFGQMTTAPVAAPPTEVPRVSFDQIPDTYWSTLFAPESAMMGIVPSGVDPQPTSQQIQTSTPQPDQGAMIFHTERSEPPQQTADRVRHLEEENARLRRQLQQSEEQKGLMSSIWGWAKKKR